MSVQLPSDEALASLRARLQGGKPPPPPEWISPQLKDFRRGLIVTAFDAALLHTGWIRFSWPAYARLPLILAHGTFNPGAPGSLGYLATWEMAARLDRELETGLFHEVVHIGDHIVIEAPPVGNAALKRTESSLIAGGVIYRQATKRGFKVTTVAVGHISKTLLGNIGHDKKAIGAAILPFFPDADRRDWSEHQRDAAAAGLTYLHDEL